MNQAPVFPLAAPDYVRQGEQVLWVGKPTMKVLVSQVFGFLFFLMIVVASFATESAADGGPSGFFALALIPYLIFTIVVGFRIRRTQYVITDQGLYTRTGLIGQSVIQTTHDKITDIALRQDIIGRLLGFSTLQVNTAGSNTAPVQMTGLPEALAVKQRIEQARDALLRRGGPQPQERRAKALPRFTLDRDIVWLNCPTTKQTFKRPRTELGTRVPCPHCGKGHLTKEPAHG